MEIGIIGLGRMGGGIGRRLLRDGHSVVGYNRSPDATAAFARDGGRGAASPAELVGALARPRAVWMMVPAGAAVDEMIATLAPLLAADDVLLDGGNSSYRDSMRRAAAAAGRGVHYLDVGTSGGIWGLEEGFCLMVGGERAAFDRLEPVFRSLAAPEGYVYAGPSGAGHFVKMVHNGVEYALLQAYGEGFELLRAAEFGLDLRAIAHLWNHGSVVRSWLLELLARALADDRDLAGVRGYVDDTGYGRETVTEAIERAVPAGVIAASLFARFRSRQDDSFAAKVIAALRNQFGGHPVRRE